MLSKQEVKRINQLLQKQIIQKFGLVAMAILIIGSVAFFGVRQNQASHAAGTGVLSLSPSSGSYVVGSNVAVQIRADSKTDLVNAVQASLTYDAAKLQYVSIAEGTAFPTVAATSTGTSGVIRLARATLPGAEVSGSNLVATVTFKVLGNTGTTNVSFDSAFSYIVRSSDNADVLGTTNGAAFTMRLPAPTISAVSPTSGSTVGGTAITITGTNFVSGATVSVGDTAANNVSVVNATTITATAPAHAAGVVSVAVSNPDSQSATKSSAFTYIAPNPTLTSVSPSTGLTTGGTSVTITGTNLTTPAAVTIGGTAATNDTLVSSTQITATTPAHTAGVVSVVVTFGGGSDAVTLNNAFTYTVPAPTVSTLSPTSGLISGGTTVTITGTNFVNVSAVTFGGTAATSVNVASNTSLTAVAPAHAAGSVAVVVTTATGSGSKANAYTYINPAPTVTAISPAAGTATGGTVVTITGTNFVNGATVAFGSTNATAVTFVSSTTLRATAPAGTGSASVVVTNPDAQKATLAAAYTYLSLGDANNDGRVNAIDLSILISHDGQNYAQADFNADGTVGSADLAILLGRWTW